MDTANAVTASFIWRLPRAYPNRSGPQGWDSDPALAMNANHPPLVLASFDAPAAESRANNEAKASLCKLQYFLMASNLALATDPPHRPSLSSPRFQLHLIQRRNEPGRVLPRPQRGGGPRSRILPLIRPRLVTCPQQLSTSRPPLIAYLKCGKTQDLREGPAGFRWGGGRARRSLREAVPPTDVTTCPTQAGRYAIGGAPPPGGKVASAWAPPPMPGVVRGPEACCSSWVCNICPSLGSHCQLVFTRFSAVSSRQALMQLGKGLQGRHNNQQLLSWPPILFWTS